MESAERATVTVQLGNSRTVLASCEGYEPHRVFNRRHR